MTKTYIVRVYENDGGNLTLLHEYETPAVSIPVPEPEPVDKQVSVIFPHNSYHHR